MKFNKKDFTNQEKIELLQRWVLVHSYLYYNLDRPVVDDYKFDMNCRQLAELKKEYPEDWTFSRYSYAMKYFDGSTGIGFVESLRGDDEESVIWDVLMLLNRR